MQEASKGKKFCNFGGTKLELRDAAHPDRFKPREEYPLETPQACLLDNVWKAETKTEKTRVCNALHYYLSKCIPPQGKNYSAYGFICDSFAGIFDSYAELDMKKRRLTNEFGYIDSNFAYKGFYSFDDAYDWVADRVDEETVIHGNYPSPKDEQELEIQALLEELKTQELETKKLKEELAQRRRKQW